MKYVMAENRGDRVIMHHASSSPRLTTSATQHACRFPYATNLIMGYCDWRLARPVVRVTTEESNIAKTQRHLTLP